MKHFLYLLGFLLTGFWVNAQDYHITGFIIDEQGIPLSNSIITLNNEDGILGYTQSESDGAFQLDFSTPGDFIINIKKFEFTEYEEEISIKKDEFVIDFGEVILFENQIELETAVITGVASKYKDTITYKVDDFRKGLEFNVEDLLKELPGFKINKDGFIEVNGKQISSVLVEGDDLFSYAYSLLTKNMPAKPLEEVELIKNYSKNKALRGIQETEQSALNLKLKEKEKGKWIATTELASTSPIENMHQVKLNLMNFKSDRKIYSLFNYNNLGIEEMKGVTYLFKPIYSGSFESVEELLKYEEDVFQSFDFLGKLDDERNNFNKDVLGAVNLIENFRKNYKLHVLGIFNRTERNKFTDRFYTFNFEDESFTNTEFKHRKNINLNSIGKIELSKESDHSDFVFFNQFSYQDSRDNNDFFFNGTNNPQNSNAYFFKSDHQINYSYKLDSISALSLNAKYVNQNKKSHYYENSDAFINETNDETADFIHQILNETMQFAGAKVSYAKKVKRKYYFESQLGGEWKKNQNLSDLFIGDETNLFSLDDFHNDFRLNLYNIYSKTAFNYHLNRNWKIDLRLKQEYLYSQLDYPETREKSNGYFLEPSANISYDRFKFGNLNLGYSRRISLSNSQNFYRNYIYVGDRFALRNDIQFSELGSHNFNLNYKRNIGNRDIEFNANLILNDRYPSTQSFIQPNFNSTVTVLMKNNQLFTSSLKYSYFLMFMNSRISVTNSFQTNTFKNKVNDGKLIDNRQNTYGLKLELKTGWLSKFNFYASYKYELRHLNSSLNKSNQNNQFYRLNANYSFSKNLIAELLLEMYDFGNTGQNLLKFLDARISYKFKKSDTQLYLNMNNLFNEKHIETYIINNVSETLFRQRILPLHIVLGCRINLF